MINLLSGPELQLVIAKHDVAKRFSCCADRMSLSGYAALSMYLLDVVLFCSYFQNLYGKTNGVWAFIDIIFKTFRNIVL